MKSKKKNVFVLPKYLFGGGVTEDPLEGYMTIKRKRMSENPGFIEDPNTAIAENNIMMAKAMEKANNNPWTQGLDIFGNLALQVGTSMMNKGISKGQGISDNGFNWGSLLKQGIGAMGTYGSTSSGMQGFAFGGKIPNIPVEIEGDEVGETPQGEVFEAKGPSHEQGGIPVALPEGTDMFSKRIKVEGKSMAERKKTRKKKEMTLEKLLETNGTDALVKNALNRTKTVNEKEEQVDMQVQKVLSALMGNADNNLEDVNNKKYQGGGTILGDSTIWGNILQQLQNGLIPNITGTSDDFHIIDNGNTEYTKKPSLATPGIVPDNNGIISLSDEEVNAKPKYEKMPKLNAGKTPEDMLGYYTEDEINDFGDTLDTDDKKDSKFKVKDIFGNITAGDLIGLTGNMINTFGPMRNTLKNRAGDTPNVNMFKEYGKDALKVLNDTKGYIAGQKDNQLQDLELARIATTKRNRNTARGVNTMRALDIATQTGANKQQSKIYDSFTEQMMKVLGQESQLENQQDGMVMQGEQNRDLADRQDRDNFYTQMAEDIATKGEGLQETGYDINKIKERGVINNLLNQLSKYGLTIDEKGILSSNGNTKSVDLKKAETGQQRNQEKQLNNVENVPDSLWSNRINPDTEKPFTSLKEYNSFLANYENNKTLYSLPLNEILNQEVDTSYKNKINPVTGKPFADYVSYSEYLNTKGPKMDLEDYSRLTGDTVYKDVDFKEAEPVIKQFLNDNGLELNLNDKNSIKVLQQLLGEKVDGVFGNDTYTALKNYKK